MRAEALSTKATSKMLPIWQWQYSGTCSLDAVLLIALLFILSSPQSNPMLAESASPHSQFETSIFSLFSTHLQAIFTKYGTWVHIPQAELNLLRNRVRDQLEMLGLRINYESKIEQCLDHLIPSRHRNFTLARKNSCAHCGYSEDEPKQVERDTLYIPVSKFMAASAQMQLRLEDMIDFSMKVRIPNRIFHFVEFVRDCAESSRKGQRERAIALIAKGQRIQFKS
jgi:hypothetical protein